MNDDKWEELVTRIERKLKVLDKKVATADEGRTRIETLIFQGPEGRMKLERVSKPLVVDKKMHYSRRIGSQPSVEYVYSPTDKVHRVQLFKWSESDGAWEEMRIDRLMPH
jgi:hypothetical protein